MFCCFKKKNKLDSALNNIQDHIENKVDDALDIVKEDIKENIDIVLDTIDDNAEDFLNSSCLDQHDANKINEALDIILNVADEKSDQIIDSTFEKIEEKIEEKIDENFEALNIDVMFESELDTNNKKKIRPDTPIPIPNTKVSEWNLSYSPKPNKSRKYN